MRNTIKFKKNNLIVTVLLLAIFLYEASYILNVFNIQIPQILLRTISSAIIILYSLPSIVNIFRITQNQQHIYYFLMLYLFIGLMAFINTDSTESIFSTLLGIFFFPITFLSLLNGLNRSFDKYIIDSFTLISCITFGSIYLYFVLINNIRVGPAINSVYYLICLLPLASTLTSKTQKKIIYALITACTLVSLKRTPFIGIILFFTINPIIESLKGKVNFKSFFTPVLGILLILSAMIFSDSKLLEDTVFQRLSNISEDNGSGRIDIANELINTIYEFSLYDYTFGSGFNSSTLFGEGLTAHNDFIESIFNFGIPGLISYLLLYISLYKTSTQLRTINKEISRLMISSIALFLSISLASHLIYIPTYIAFICIFWSYSINHSKIKDNITKLSGSKVTFVESGYDHRQEDRRPQA